MDARPSKVETFMLMAQMMADRSTCRSKHAVGAILVDKYDHIIATGYNGAPSKWPHCDDPITGVNCVLDEYGRCVRALHAEENVLAQCALNGVSSRDCTLFCTLAPCTRCGRMLAQAGIRTVWYMGEPSSSNALSILKGYITMHKFETRIGADRTGYYGDLRQGVYGS